MKIHRIKFKRQWNVLGGFDWLPLTKPKKVIKPGTMIENRVRTTGFHEFYPSGVHGDTLIVWYNAERFKVVNGIVKEK